MLRSLLTAGLRPLSSSRPPPTAPRTAEKHRALRRLWASLMLMLMLMLMLCLCPRLFI